MSHPLFGDKKVMPINQAPTLSSVVGLGTPEDEERKVQEIISNLYERDLIEELPDGRIRLRGTEAEIESAGLSMKSLQKFMEKGYKDANATVEELEERHRMLLMERNAILQRKAWLEQQAGITPAFLDDTLYFVHDPRGGKTPMAIPGSMMRDFYASGFADEYRLLGPDEVPMDETLEANVVVGFQQDDSMPSEIHSWQAKIQGFVDLQ